MTKALSATERGLDPYWKVRLWLHGGVIHLAALAEPMPVIENGRLVEVLADWIEDQDTGDTLGFIDWSAVIGVTWRYAP